MKKILLRTVLGSAIAGWSSLAAAHDGIAQPSESVGVAIGMASATDVAMLLTPGVNSVIGRPAANAPPMATTTTLPLHSTITLLPPTSAFVGALTPSGQGLTNYASPQPSYCVIGQDQNLWTPHLSETQICGASPQRDDWGKVQIKNAAGYGINGAQSHHWSADTFTRVGERHGVDEFDSSDWRAWSGTIPEDKLLGDMTVANTGLRYKVHSKAIDLVLDF